MILDEIPELVANQTGTVNLTVRTTASESSRVGKPGEDTLIFRLDAPDGRIQWSALRQESFKADGENEEYRLSRDFTVDLPGEYKLTVSYNGESDQRHFIVEPEISLEIGPRAKDGTLAEGQEKTLISTYTDLRFMAAYEESNLNFIWQFMQELPVDREALEGILQVAREEVQLDEENKIVSLVLRVKPICPENRRRPVWASISVVTEAKQELQRDVQVSNGIVAELAFRSMSRVGAKVQNSKETNLSHLFYYTDEFFYKSAYQYNNSLAVMTLGLELSAYTSPHSDSFYDQDLSNNPSLTQLRASNLFSTCGTLGFSQITANDGKWMYPELHNYEVPLSDPRDKAAFSFATKYVSSRTSDDTLVAVVVRGGGYGAEWSSNFNVGNSGNHQGFQTAASEVERALDDYVSRLAKDGRIIGNLKLWVTGYSRGAAVANMFSFAMNNRKTIGSVETMPQDQFVYTFATPAGYRGTHGKASNIFNLVAENDIVPKLALKSWGFMRYGNTVYLPENTTESVENAFFRLTGEKLKVTDMDFFERTVIDILSRLYPDTASFTVSAQGYITRFIAESYLTIDGDFTSQFGRGLLEGIRQDKIEPMLAALNAQSELTPHEIVDILRSGDHVHDAFYDLLEAQIVKYMETTKLKLATGAAVADCLLDIGGSVMSYWNQEEEGKKEKYIFQLLYDYVIYRESGNEGSISVYLLGESWKNIPGIQFVATAMKLGSDVGGIVSGQFHFPEYYLSWLETGGTADADKDFALLTSEEKQAIGQQLEALAQ